MAMFKKVVALILMLSVFGHVYASYNINKDGITYHTSISNAPCVECGDKYCKYYASNGCLKGSQLKKDIWGGMNSICTNVREDQENILTLTTTYSGPTQDGIKCDTSGREDLDKSFIYTEATYNSNADCKGESGTTSGAVTYDGICYDGVIRVVSDCTKTGALQTHTYDSTDQLCIGAAATSSPTTLGHTYAGASPYWCDGSTKKDCRAQVTPTPVNPDDPDDPDDPPDADGDCVTIGLDTPCYPNGNKCCQPTKTQSGDPCCDDGCDSKCKKYTCQKKEDGSTGSTCKEIKEVSKAWKASNFAPTFVFAMAYLSVALLL